MSITLSRFPDVTLNIRRTFITLLYTKTSSSPMNWQPTTFLLFGRVRHVFPEAESNTCTPGPSMIGSPQTIIKSSFGDKIQWGSPWSSHNGRVKSLSQTIHPIFDICSVPSVPLLLMVSIWYFGPTVKRWYLLLHAMTNLCPIGTPVHKIVPFATASKMITSPWLPTQAISSFDIDIILVIPSSTSQRLMHSHTSKFHSSGCLFCANRTTPCVTGINDVK